MVTERIHGETYKHKVADIEGYVDPTAVITAHKAEADAHAAANITNVPAGDIAAVTVQAALNELDSEKVSKAGSLTQITTRNHNDLQNLNAGSAHPSASIDNTSTSYGRGLATTDNTVQKIADRVNQNGTPQFVTDKTKCSLLLDFEGTLADRSRAINPIGSDAANKWTDNFVNDSTTKTSATNISCTLKQFEGDEGKFGSGIAVEESRTNLWPDGITKDVITNGVYRGYTDNYSDEYMEFSTYKLASSPVNSNVIKLKYKSGNDNFIYKDVLPTGNPVTASLWVKGTGTFSISIGDNIKPTITSSNKWMRIQQTGTPFYASARIFIESGELEFCGIQFEVGAFPTSYIATGATAVTRPAGNLKFNSPINNYGDFTISGWYQFNANSTNITAVPHLFELYDSGTARFNIYYDITTQKIGSYIYNGSAFVYPNLNFAFNAGEKHHILLKVESNILKVYINKNLAYSSDITSFRFNTPYIAIGSSSLGGNDKINGTISNFAIFNYALSDAEISQIYNSGLEGKPIAITNPESIIGVGQTLHDPNFITFTSGWGISTTYPNKPTLSKSSNVALMRGILEYSGVVNSDVTLFTLPVGARPSLPDTYYHSFVATARDSGSPTMRILRVYGNGDVKLMANGATITNPAISLDNINYVNGK